MGSNSGRSPLRVLCLGDSLTGGFPAQHPYGGKLEERLEAAFPTTHHVEVEVDGVPGEMVTGGRFARRMRNLWRMYPDERAFDWTIVLGGTNDLAWRHPASEVLQELERVWAIPLSKGSKVLALTIPECKVVNEALDEARKTINDGIKACNKQNFYTFDLHKAVPFHSMSTEDRVKYWDPDGVHFTEAGYDLIGEKVAEGLIKILHLEEAQSTEISSIVSDERQRKLIEELIFEEERGNPRLLSQGWIIVRKRDLD
ncbi:hypothetical protein PFICI_00547 [Pestalotiopsis fici W106-1]|uniref:SGNH hydrolase-type esterase domain-containing protein n=1 Tax=Pestalotiopsis fici (strain W106-1 / CGMCC3.15140) TaxID=1229662 RepID=W3XL59_PESFW|nr:uncharacterized protein PFICI_00547 [Pestalotiopsis fici W106-1]ETS86719.1 hypothetical protein PFICI_00547 [Pestalotiopsis fici W106-1]